MRDGVEGSAARRALLVAGRSLAPNRLRQIAVDVLPAGALALGSLAVGLIPGLGSVALSIALALVALYWRRMPVLRRRLEQRPGLAAGVMRGLQSGASNDYVTWIVFGLACIGGGALALAIR